MHVVTWILTGLLVGWLARIAWGVRDAGLPVDLTLGCLGAAAGGWMFHMLGISEANAGVSHVAVAGLGALTVLMAARLLLRASARAVTQTGATQAMTALEHHVTKVLHRKPVARDPNQAFEEQLTLGQRVSDRLASFGGSWTFLGLFFATMLGWMIYNTERPPAFDPYPFILLNLVLSCLAAVQAPVILMSQNRQSEKDRLHARLDYEVNLKAELEILALHEKLDGLREKAWGELVALQERQLTLLAQIEQQSRLARNAGT